MTNENKLALVLQENKLDPTETLDEQKIFSPFFEQVDKMKEACNAIVITSVEQVDDMVLAREYRLALQKIRTSGAKEKDRLKEIPLRKCQAIDALNRYLVSEVKPLEAHLQEQEDFIENAKKKIADELEANRKQELDKYEGSYEFINLREMPEDNYQTLLNQTKDTYKLKKDKEEAEEKARVAQEKADQEERERVRIENEKLKADMKKREDDEAKRRKIEKDKQDEIDAENAKKLKEAEDMAKQARKALEEKEAEDERARVAEAKKKKDEEEAQKKAEQAPDKKKLEELATKIVSIELPTLKTENAKVILTAVVELLNRTSNYIKEKTINL